MGQVASAHCRHHRGSSTIVVDSQRGRCCSWQWRQGGRIIGSGGKTAVEDAQGLQQTHRKVGSVLHSVLQGRVRRGLLTLQVTPPPESVF